MEKGSSEEQYLKMQSCSGRHRRVLEAFEEIQLGPNPLTQHDVEALVKKRPQHYLSLTTIKLGLEEATQ